MNQKTFISSWNKYLAYILIFGHCSFPLDDLFQPSLILIFSSLEMTLGRPEPSFLSAMGASEFFLAWSKILRRLLSGILSCALICFRGTEAFQSSTAALLTSLVGGIFKTGETRKIGLAYILRNGEFSCGRTVKFRPDLIRDHSSIPKKFGVPISKGLGAVHCQRPANFFCADCSSLLFLGFLLYVYLRLDLSFLV